MSRKNALTKKKLKRSVFTLIAIFIFIFSIIIINMIVQDTKSNVATSEEMKACSSTIESIYKKLDPEEIKFLSKDGSYTLSYAIPNKAFGQVTISRDSDGNIAISYDYQEKDVLFETFMMTIFIAFAFVLFICFIMETLKDIKKKKENKAHAESQLETK